MRIALIGAGSIGTIMGAHMTKAGEDVLLVDTNKDHVDALNKNGAKIVGHLDMTVPVKAALPEDMEGTYDLLILLTKQTVLKHVLEANRKHMHEDTIVLTLQNGIPEDISKTFVGEDRVLGGGVEYSATYIEPGVSELTCGANNVAITFGRLDGKITEKTLEVQKVFSGLAHAEIAENLMGTRYTKLTDNSVFSGLPTALACDIGKVLDDEKAMKVIAHLGREAGIVIEKLGIEPVELFGLQPFMENVYFENAEEREKVIKDYWTPIYTPYRQQIASMLQDIRNGRKCEINFINGKFVEKAKEVGVEVPFMERVVEIVTKLQDGELSLDNAWNNLDLFDVPELV
ncbi:MAG: 2-dehydropantoate 2-reductase [Firmicutes bacterium]|jgi:2-dehydropantoate 2-reductase|nr:2-dehydropantoate 2-reductase [Bacillota bacterium]